MNIHLKTIESSLPKDDLCHVWLKLANFVNVFIDIFLLSPFGKEHEPFLITHLYPLHHKILCAKFSLNWLSGSGEEDLQFIFAFVILLSRKRDLHLNKLESPLPKDALCQVWLK